MSFRRSPRPLRIPAPLAPQTQNPRTATVGHTLRGESLLKTVIEGKLLGKGSRGRPRQMLLDWMMVEGYEKLKEVQQRESFEPA